MWISKKKYNEIIKEKDNIAKICDRAVAQNERLLERWQEQLDFDTELNEENKQLKKALDEMSALADERYEEIIYLRERIAELERGEDDGR